MAIISTISIAQNHGTLPQRPEGPCDVYAKGGAPCAAAHSSTRALYASYNGPLYQVMRQSDGKTLDIGVVQPSVGDPGGYADAAAQDEFCKDTYCWLTILYDQSPNENHLQQAPRGGFSGLAMGGFNNLPMADWAPVTLMGHKVYGVFITAGMGLRWNDAKGTAVDDQAEGQYWVINGHHYNSGCCFDYGNAETDSRDDGDGTMETTYYGNQAFWYHGSGPGPWIMTDQENNLVGCVNPDPNDKFCETIPSINWRFVTATADGKPHRWRSMGGNAQSGELVTYYDGVRIQNERNSYDPMRKQGAILLGNGGDNSVGSSGTFYEAAMTAPNTYPSEELNQAIQANVVAAKYNVQRLSINPSDKLNAPNALQTFTPRSSQNVIVRFENTSDKEISDLVISLKTPKGWKANLLNSKEKVKKVEGKLAPGQVVVVNFRVKSACRLFNGDLATVATWTNDKAQKMSETSVQKVRNVAPIKINEFRIADGNGNTTNSFIELYNDSEKPVDISKWSLTTHAVNIPHFSSINIPRGTKIEGKGFYLLGLATSGLVTEANKGDDVIYVRSTKGISVGDEIEIGGEKRIVKKINNPAETMVQVGRFRQPIGTPTTVWQPLPDGPVITIPVGSNNVPVTSTAGFKVGQKMAIGYGATYPAVYSSIEKYEVVTITEVGKPGTQAWLSMDAKKGDTNIKVSSVENITAGDKIRLDIESLGHGIETVTVKSVGTASVRSTFDGPLRPGEDPGTGLELEEPLKFDHASNMPFSVRGTGISFEPATQYPHSSNEPVLALVYSLELDAPLSSNHPIDEVVYDAKVSNAGYQGCTAADQLYGGPEFSNRKGSILLCDAKGRVVDALNYGGVVDPWLSEGYHGESGTGKEGNFVQTPAYVPNFRLGPSPNVSPNLSAGRFPDGHDTDDNQLDFKVQNSMHLNLDALAGSETISVTSIEGLNISDKFVIGAGATLEEVHISIINAEDATLILSMPLRFNHAKGEAMVRNIPTPGAPNRY